MNKVIAILCAAGLAVSFGGTAAAAPMTDDSILQMVKAGFGQEVVIAKIKASQTAFDVSDSKLVELKTSGVPDPVIAAMISAGGEADSASLDSPDPSVSHKPGLYVLNTWDSPSHMQIVDSQTSKSVKMTNGFGAFMLGAAISPMHSQAAFDGACAKVKVNFKRPIFYFYFNRNATSADISSSDNIINSPDDFSLVRLLVDHDHRGLTVGKNGGVLGGISSGISEKERIDFVSKPISNYTYEVTINGPLPDGEYAFVVGKGEGHALKAYPFSVVSTMPSPSAHPIAAIIP